MSGRLVVWIVAALCLCGAAWPVAAQDRDELRQEQDSIRQILDSIRDDLVGLEFEKALASIDAVLGEPGMTRTERAELLVLRAETHVAFGDLDAAEEDYRLILNMRPGYVPEVSLTPQKALKRFEKVRAATIGRLELTLDPPDAVAVVEGQPLSAGPDGSVPLVAGEYELTIERPGHDSHRQVVEIEPGAATALEIQLMPNSRSVVVRTEPDEVEILLDGVSVGVTQRSGWSKSETQYPAELLIENVPLGEHRFELRKECYRTERMTDTLTVDLLDRAPKRYRAVSLAESKSRLTVAGGPEGAEVIVDGRGVARLPTDPVQVCAGTRAVEVQLAERVLFRSTESFVEGAETPVVVDPRPNVVLVGAEEWPREWRAWISGMNDLGRPEPASRTDLSSPGGWGGLALGENIDLALAIIPAGRGGAQDRWYLYSPVLRHVAMVDVAPDAERPIWSTRYWGFATADSEIGGALRVVRVDPGGPAAEAGLALGDRIIALDGREVEGSAGLRRSLAGAGDAGVKLQWRDAGDQPQESAVVSRPSPRLVASHDDPARAMLRAAWAVTDAAGRPGDAPTALANLALLFDAFGEPGLAVESWRHVRLGERAGIGEGTRQYYMGRALERLGREEEAIIAYRRAASSTSTTFDDAGPRVAPAAADRLADLGVTD